MGFRTRRILELPAVTRPTSVNLKKIDETSSSTCRPSALGRPSTLPSGSRPSDSVLAFYVGTFLWEGATDVQMFYVLKSTLRNLAKRGTTRVRGNFPPFSSCMNYLAQCAAPHILPWHQWGPESTRWIHVEKVPKICALSGTRCVISKRLGGVRMLDFNPERLLWIKDWIEHKTKSGETGVEDWSVVASPTTIPAGEYFLCDIESKLPYYELRKAGVEGDLFIDDELAVLIRVCSDHYNVADIRLISNIFCLSSHRGGNQIFMEIFSGVYFFRGSHVMCSDKNVAYPCPIFSDNPQT